MRILEGKEKRRLRAEVQELTSNAAKLRDEVKHYKYVQELLVDNILAVVEDEENYVGNDYRDYPTAVQEISDKHNCLAKWGCLQTKTIINLRAAFILGDGLRITHTTETRAEAEQELKFVEDFRKFNDLDGGLDQEMAKEAEIEGKIAVRLFADKEPYLTWPGMISARYISWLSKKYTVTADPNDYLWYKKLTWLATATSPAGDVDEPEFVYSKFGGRINDPNQANPTIQGCLTQIDRLDKALRDLREINHLFAAQTPHFKCAEKAEVQAITDYIEARNWRIGKAIATMAEFKLVGPDAGGVDMLIKEIELLVKMVSGTTGIPIHYLGLLDLLKNRATGENTRELIMATTTRERQTWISVYEDMFTKAMELYNVTFAAQYSKAKRLDPSRVKVDIPQITQEHWDRIAAVLIPAAAANIISREHVASQIPGVDTAKEAELREKRDAEEAERAKEDAQALADRMEVSEKEARK